MKIKKSVLKEAIHEVIQEQQLLTEAPKWDAKAKKEGEAAYKHQRELIRLSKQLLEAFNKGAFGKFSAKYLFDLSSKDLIEKLIESFDWKKDEIIDTIEREAKKDW